MGAQAKKPSVQSKRQGLYRSIYFMSQLPDSEQQERGGLPGDEEVDFNSQPNHRTASQQGKYHLLRFSSVTKSRRISSYTTLPMADLAK